MSHKMLLGMKLPNFCVTCKLEKSAKIIEEMQVKKDDIEKEKRIGEGQMENLRFFKNS